MSGSFDSGRCVARSNSTGPISQSQPDRTLTDSISICSVKAPGPMHICLDVDDTITYAPQFFADLCARFADAKITIVTFRSDLAKTTEYLDSAGIRYDHVVVSTDPEHGKQADESLHEWKAGFINRLRPDMFFEDMPEVVCLVDALILVFMPCDEIIRDWITSQLRQRQSN